MLRALRKSGTKAKKRASTAAADLSSEDTELFEALRTVRTELAREQNVPPYVIFPDRTLTEMAIAKPTNEVEMLEVSGVGQNKYARYGNAFLKIIETCRGTRK